VKGHIPLKAETGVTNMHCHTLLLVMATHHSSLAWLARKTVSGDQDRCSCLDGVDEFLNACEKLSVRGSAGMETRIFIPEFATREINSPGEPGVYYHMGIGFTSSRVPAEAMPVLEDLHQRATLRNRLVLERVNEYLYPVTVDYEGDVLPLTPAGTATERHMVLAYLQAVERSVTDPVSFWAEKLQINREQTAALFADSPNFQNLVRSNLMKRGGVGYIKPTAGTFPSIQEVNRLITACGALPCATWLDGASEGEQAILELFELQISQGAVALNLIPDRNWNIADIDIRRSKVQKLYEIVQLAKDLDLPLNVGTEMNSFGQKLVDDFDAPELAPVRQSFLDGAHFIYGHTTLQRVIGLGYRSDWAQAYLPTRQDRNTFYTRAGYQIPPGRAGIEKLKSLSQNQTPQEILGAL
jgi:hypothetical protein